MRDRALAVFCGRKMSCALDRKRRKLFFLLSLQDHDPNLGISKHTPHPSARPESRKAIASSSLFFFPGIQASCHSREGLSLRSDSCQGASGGAFRAQNPHFSPTRFHEDPFVVWFARSRRCSHRRRVIALTPELTSWFSGLSMAGFEVTLYGRIWVTPEENEGSEKRVSPSG